MKWVGNGKRFNKSKRNSRITLNLGNFQSLRLDLGVIDSKRDGETTEQAFERVYKFVEEKLTDKIKEAQEEAAEA